MGHIHPNSCSLRDSEITSDNVFVESLVMPVKRLHKGTTLLADRPDAYL